VSEKARGSKLRQSQVEIILHGVVSRLNEYRADHAPDQHAGLWFLAGDFNATPDAPEISTISRMNFARLCNEDPTKRSRRGGDASIKVDYIFVGPKYYAFDPCVLQQGNDANQGYQILKDIGSSDHYPIVARFPIG
jgi:endonuclease/exonuclease/phosphatase family metal-dependent hydrolase